MSKTRELAIKLKDQQLSTLMKDCEAVAKQLNSSDDPVERNRLRRKQEDLLAEAQAIEEEIQRIRQEDDSVSPESLQILTIYYSDLQASIPKAYRACGMAGAVPGDLHSLYAELENAPQGTASHRPIEQFVGHLVSDRQLSPAAVTALSAYGARTIPNFSELVNTLSSRSTADPLDPAYLLIKLRLSQQDSTRINASEPYYFVDAWIIPNWQSYDPQTGLGCTRLEMPELMERTYTLEELPGILAECLNECARIREVEPIIEVFLPLDALNLAIEEWCIEGDLEPLCSQYMIVLRSTDRLTRRHRRHRPKWRQRWESLGPDHALSQFFISGNCQLCGSGVTECSELEDLMRVIQLNPSAFGLQFLLQCGKRDPYTLFNVMIQLGIPAALWLRETAQDTHTRAELEAILDGAWSQVQERIRQRRTEAIGRPEHIGAHLSWMWEDPNRLPPEVDYAS